MGFVERFTTQPTSSSGRLSLVLGFVVLAEILVLRWVSTGTYAALSSAPNASMLFWAHAVSKTIPVGFIALFSISILRGTWRDPYIQHANTWRIVCSINFAALIALLMLQFVLPNGVVDRPLTGLETTQFAGAIVAWSVLCLSGIVLITPKQLVASKARPELLLAIAAILIAGLTNETYAITGLLEAPRVAFEEATLNLTVWFYELSGRPTPHLSFDDGVPALSASGFAILIGQSCMGYQGVASASVLLGGYIAIEWRRLNVARAVCLVAAAVVATFVLNSARIAMLFYIGEEVSPEVAVNGFHSNFGTFALFLISFVSIMSMEFSYFRRGTGQEDQQTSPRDHSAALAGAAKYMFPLTVYLVSAMFTGLFSGEFNWFYPVPVLVGCITLWIMRPHFSDVFAQRVNPEGILAGMLAFAIWVALIPVDAERHTLLTGTLTEAPMWLAAVWVVFRVFGSSIVVPIVEELAFRGGLQRVFQDIIPESCPSHLRTILAVLGSAIAFGLLHSDILAGILVGILYGGVVWRTGKVLDAIVAHAITNFLICVLVLGVGYWSYW